MEYRGKAVSRRPISLPDNYVLDRNLAPHVVGFLQVLGAGEEGEEVLWLLSWGPTDVGISTAIRNAVTGRDVLRIPSELDRYGQLVRGQGIGEYAVSSVHTAGATR